MSLMTYDNVRPWAKAIKAAVINKQMPPWFADPHYGEFRNAPKLTQADVNTLVAWVDTGAREGDIADRPAARQWTSGWGIQPDVVVSMREPYYIPATGAGEIKEFFIDNPFTKDTWVTSIEIRPGNPSVVHHVIVQIPEQTGPAAAVQNVAVAPDGPRLVVDRAAVFDQVPQGGGSYFGALVRMQERMTGRGAFMTMEAVYAPGSPTIDFR